MAIFFSNANIKQLNQHTRTEALKSFPCLPFLVIKKSVPYHLSYSIYKHEAIDIADPSSM